MQNQFVWVINNIGETFNSFNIWTHCGGKTICFYKMNSLWIIRTVLPQDVMCDRSSLYWSDIFTTRGKKRIKMICGPLCSSNAQKVWLYRPSLLIRRSANGSWFTLTHKRFSDKNQAEKVVHKSPSRPRHTSHTSTTVQDLLHTCTRARQAHMSRLISCLWKRLLHPVHTQNGLQASIMFRIL